MQHPASKYSPNAASQIHKGTYGIQAGMTSGKVVLNIWNPRYSLLERAQEMYLEVQADRSSKLAVGDE